MSAVEVPASSHERLPADRLRISLALSTWNGSRYLEEQLQSIEGQTRHPDELIVRDDCSTDSSVEILRRFGRRAPFPVVILEGRRRLGATSSFEVAMQACSGDVVALCDQDDIWSKEKLRQVELEFLEHPETALLFSNAELLDRHGRPIGFSLWDIREHDGRGRWVFGHRRSRPQLFPFAAPGCTIAYRSSLHDLALPIPQGSLELRRNLYHDRWLLAIGSAAGTVRILDEKLVGYRLHPDQHIGLGAIVRRVADHRMLWVFRASRRLSPRWNTSAALRGLPFLTAWIVRLDAVASPAHAAEQLADFSGFLVTRSTLPPTLIRRSAEVLRLWLSGRYHQYANGIASATRDLLAPRRLS